MLVGKLASMPRREAERIVREHGGSLVDRGGELADLVVTSDESADVARLAANRELFDDALRARIAGGEAELLGESALWARLGLVESGQGVERLYTPAMLAELVRVPIAAIRQWHRRGAIVAKREVQRLAYFDFEEVGVARKLAQLLAAGCSLAAVNRKLEGLARLLPEVARPLADPAVVVEGRCLFVRRGEGLAEPSGQLLIDFDAAKPQAAEGLADEGPATIPLVAGDALHKASEQVRGRGRRFAGVGGRVGGHGPAGTGGGGVSGGAVFGRFDGGGSIRAGGVVVFGRRHGGGAGAVLRGHRTGRGLCGGPLELGLRAGGIGRTWLG